MVAKPVGAATAEPLLIPQETVNEYARINAEIAVLTRQRDELRSTILELFDQGYCCPAKGPWMVVKSIQERCKASWKDICMAVVAMLGERLRRQAAKLIDEMQADKIDVPMLNVKVNADYDPRE